mmetsp:Transcript_3277/g.20420  ORF Transcript_3277/g.20420 Transcript_3277/m.20420 type:complete len:159 (+) Transcript_3277:201-677(+)
MMATMRTTPSYGRRSPATWMYKNQTKPTWMNGRRTTTTNPCKPHRHVTRADVEPREPYTTLGGDPESIENFDWGHRDGHHTWHKPTSGSWLSETQKALERSGGPTSLQNLFLSIAAVAAVTLGVAGGKENAELTTACTIVLMVCLTGSTIVGGLRESD